MRRAAPLLLLAIALAAGVGFWLGTRGLGTGPGDGERPLDLPEVGGRITLVQRHDADVPGSGGRLRVHLGDITRGQVEVTIARREGAPLLAPTSAQEGSRLDFAFAGHRYFVRVVRLHNVLVGDDTAVLEFGEGVSEQDRIGALLEAMEASDLTFLRNGSEYTGTEAAAHLRRKRGVAGERVRTARQFVDALATRSTMTGKPYEVRLHDGTIVPLAKWLDERLTEQSSRH